MLPVDQWWCSGESIRLPPMWPGFDSQTRRHMWVGLLVLYSAQRVFSPGTPVFPSPQKPTFDLVWFEMTVSPISASVLEALI